MKYFFFILLPFIGLAQNSENQFVNYYETGTFVAIVTNEGEYQFSSLSDHSIQTAFLPKGENTLAPSHAIVAAPYNMPFQVVNTAEKLYLDRKGMRITIQKAPFEIAYSYYGNPLLKEQNGFVKKDEGYSIELAISSNEVLYGGGARALGMNRRGNKLELYNRAHYGYEERSELMNFTMPIVISSNKYLVHFDNPSTGFLDFDSEHNNTIRYEASSGRMCYQVVFAENWSELTPNYIALTGTQPLHPLWAFGNFASRFGYHSQAEATSVVNAFRKEGIPLDAIILDLYWFGKDIQGTMGNLSFYTDSFPEPKQMISNFQMQNVQTVLITEPFILTTSKRWEETKSFLAKDDKGNPYTYNFYFGNTGLLDIYQPQTRRWFWNIYKDLHAYGATGIWGDLGEPEVHPKELMHAAGPANSVHNIYGHDWARLIQEGYRNDFPNERPFILMRAGYSGSQRYDMIPWSGDVNRSWGGLKSQPEIALQMGLQGMAYMHSDLGGFAGDYNDNELYTRWLQYGVFQPIFRPHSQEQVASEPIFKDARTKAIAKQAIDLRYRLLPYNYSIAYENSRLGTPLMRPAFFLSTDSCYLKETTVYNWGPAFLVAPVTEKGQKEMVIILPYGTQWFDYYTEKVYEGGKQLIVQLNDTTIPTFVKGGSFVPTVSAIQSTADYAKGTIEIHFYKDA